MKLKLQNYNRKRNKRYREIEEEITELNKRRIKVIKRKSRIKKIEHKEREIR